MFYFLFNLIIVSLEKEKFFLFFEQINLISCYSFNLISVGKYYLFRRPTKLSIFSIYFYGINLLSFVVYSVCFYLDKSQALPLLNYFIDPIYFQVLISIFISLSFFFFTLIVFLSFCSLRKYFLELLFKVFLLGLKYNNKFFLK